MKKLREITFIQSIDELNAKTDRSGCGTGFGGGNEVDEYRVPREAVVKVKGDES